MDKYGTGQDPYCDTATGVLINKLGIYDSKELEEAEQALTNASQEAISFREPPYDFTFLKHLHQLLFDDVYPWAGKIRTVDISKGDTRFCAASRIEPEARKLFDTLADNQWLSTLSKPDLSLQLAQFYGDLNVVHPFREGNGRAMRMLCEFIVINAGYGIDWTCTDQNQWLQASIDAVTCDYRKMRQAFETCIGPHIVV